MKEKYSVIPNGINIQRSKRITEGACSKRSNDLLDIALIQKNYN
jgi:hypothetical protein|tara:strand:+ start:100 stop:231 length:132 start_codon:yes stop_codon:yes gene_type:complete